MSDEIPLVKDILGVYPDAKINDHLNTDMIKMYNEFINVSNTTNVVNVAISNNYTNVQIYDYIKFINMTCLGTECYKHVIPYITEDNIDTVLQKVGEWYDIKEVKVNSSSTDKFTGMIKRTKKLSDLLRQLEKISNYKFKIQDGRVLVM